MIKLTRQQQAKTLKRKMKQMITKGRKSLQSEIDETERIAKDEIEEILQTCYGITGHVFIPQVTVELDNCEEIKVIPDVYGQGFDPRSDWWDVPQRRVIYRAIQTIFKMGGYRDRNAVKQWIIGYLKTGT